MSNRSTARLTLPNSSFLNEVYSAPKSLVQEWANQTGVQTHNSDSDLVKGFYEGGFKVWEATRDLVKFVSEDQKYVGKFLARNKELRILELGCGAGLVTLAFLSRLLGDDNDFSSDYRVHLQDYNWNVLTTLTLLNFGFNLPKDYLTSLIRTKSLRFFHGDWRKFRHKKGSSQRQYDLILTSETIYDSQNFSILHDLLEKHLKLDGYILIATKDTYFGLTGGLYAWLDHVTKQGVFREVEIKKTCLINVPRSILILSRSENRANGVV